MIDRNLLNYPEQLVARLTKMEQEIAANKLEIQRLRKLIGKG